MPPAHDREPTGSMHSQIFGSRSSQPRAQNAVMRGGGLPLPRFRPHRCDRGCRAWHRTNERRARLQTADQPMQVLIQSSSSFALPFVCRCVVGSHGPVHCSVTSRKQAAHLPLEDRRCVRQRDGLASSVSKACFLRKQALEMALLHRCR
jgi:hypothetical protein